MKRIEKLTERVSRIVERTECCVCYVYSLDGKEVLQAYQGFFYASSPSYSEILELGTRKEIGKTAFQNELNRICALN